MPLKIVLDFVFNPPFRNGHLRIEKLYLSFSP